MINQAVLSYIGTQHRPSDFAYIVDGVLGIFEQHMTVINNLLPGSKKPVPHLLETSKECLIVRCSFSTNDLVSLVSMEDDRAEQGNCSRRIY